jgi:WD40 repeat protein
MDSNVNQKINALLDAFDSDEGIESIVQALGDSVREVRETAYWLLTETKTQATEQALRSYPYSQMQLLHTIAGRSEREPHYFAINTDKKALLSNCHSEESKGYAYASIKIWNLQTGELADTLPFTHEHMGTGQNGQIIVWHFQHIIDVRKSGGSPTLYGSIQIASLAVSDDGSIVTCGGYQRDAQELLGRIEIWDLHAGRLIKLLEWKPTRYTSFQLPMMISPNASLLLSQDNKRLDSHRLWSLQTGELIRVFETSPYWFADAIANTSDGDCIVSGLREQSVKVWDINTDRVIYTFAGQAPTAMTPDGKVLAYCNDTNEVVLWDLEVNQKICTFPGNTSPIQAICLSSDREWVVSYDTDQTIKIHGLLDE